VSSDQDFEVAVFFEMKYLNTVQDRSILLLNVNKKSYAVYRTVLFPVTFIDPNPVFKDTALFKDEYRKKSYILVTVRRK